MSAPVNDVVCTILQTPFSRWNDDHRRDVLRCGRPTPYLDFTDETKSGKSDNSFRRAWYRTYSWLCGSYYYNGLYCWPCLLVGNERTRLNSEGVCDINHALKCHPCSVDHMICMEQLKNLRRIINSDYSSSPAPPPPPSSPSPPSPPPSFLTYTSAPANDIVCKLLVRPFYTWSVEDKAVVLAHGRPTPILDLRDKNELRKVGNSNNIKFRLSWYAYEEHEWLCGSYYTERLYCWPCLLLGSNRLIWNCYGSDLKSINRKAEVHSKRVNHIMNVVKLKDLHNSLKREVEDSIKQQGLVKSSECKQSVGSSAEVSEQPNLSESGMHNNSFEMDDASVSAYQCGEPEKLKNIGEPRRQFSPVEVLEPMVVIKKERECADELSLPITKSEPLDLKDEPYRECADELSLPITKSEPLDLKDEPYELISVKVEKDEELLQRPEFIPVEEDYEF